MVSKCIMQVVPRTPVRNGNIGFGYDKWEQRHVNNRVHVRWSPDNDGMAVAFGNQCHCSCLQVSSQWMRSPTSSDPLSYNCTASHWSRNGCVRTVRNARLPQGHCVWQMYLVLAAAKNHECTVCCDKQCLA